VTDGYHLRREAVESPEVVVVRKEHAMGAEERRIARLRLLANRQGLVLRKRAARRRSADDPDGYALIDADHNVIVAGPRYDLTLDQVEAWLHH
jgi:hypothetical protein